MWLRLGHVLRDFIENVRFSTPLFQLLLLKHEECRFITNVGNENIIMSSKYELQFVNVCYDEITNKAKCACAVQTTGRHKIRKRARQIYLSNILHPLAGKSDCNMQIPKSSVFVEK